MRFIDIKYYLIFISIFLTLNLNAQWVMRGQEILGIGQYHQIGRSVCLSADGNKLVIGAYRFTGTDPANFVVNEGYVITYELINGYWIRVGIVLVGDDEGDIFGSSLDLSSNGKFLIVGAPGPFGSGRYVKVYEWIQNNWQQMGEAMIGDFGDGFGFDVAIADHGELLIVGAPGCQACTNTSGYIKMFYWNQNEWVQLGETYIGESSDERFGYSVAMSDNGELIAAGSYLSDGNGVNSGSVKIFELGTGNYYQKGVTLYGVNAGDRFGASVAIDSPGSRVAASATLNDGSYNNAGHTVIYEWINNEWYQVGNAIGGRVAGEQSGSSISISSDGRIIAIGSRGNNTAGSNSGSVRVFELIGNIWIQIGDDIDGEASNDAFGYSVSLSSTGDMIAIGAPFNNGNGWDSGHVKVFTSGSIVAIEDLAENAFQIFPNPINSNETINIHTEKINTIKVFSLNGRLIINEEYSIPHYGNVQLELNQLATGMYFIELNDVARQKLIVVH